MIFYLYSTCMSTIMASKLWESCISLWRYCSIMLPLTNSLSEGQVKGILLTTAQKIHLLKNVRTESYIWGTRSDRCLREACVALTDRWAGRRWNKSSTVGWIKLADLIWTVHVRNIGEGSGSASASEGVLIKFYLSKQRCLVCKLPVLQHGLSVETWRGGSEFWRPFEQIGAG